MINYVRVQSSAKWRDLLAPHENSQHAAKHHKDQNLGIKNMLPTHTHSKNKKRVSTFEVENLEKDWKFYISLLAMQNTRPRY